jgi:hypothetical protein
MAVTLSLYSDPKISPSVMPNADVELFSCKLSCQIPKTARNQARKNARKENPQGSTNPGLFEGRTRKPLRRMRLRP